MAKLSKRFIDPTNTAIPYCCDGDTMSPKVCVAFFIIKRSHPISVPVEHKFIPPAPQFYNLSEYPTFTVKFNSDGYINGYHIANITIALVHYLGESKQLELTAYLRIRIYTSCKPGGPYPYAGIKLTIQRIHRIVYHPEDIERYQPPTLVGYRSPDEDTIPTDLYYSNLDGDRNADNDNVWR